MTVKSKILLLGAAFLSFSVSGQELSGQFTGDISNAPVFVTDAGATSVTVSFTTQMCSLTSHHLAIILIAVPW